MIKIENPQQAARLARMNEVEWKALHQQLLNADSVEGVEAIRKRLVQLAEIEAGINVLCGECENRMTEENLEKDIPADE